MLKELEVKNFAIIDSLHISFASGFTTLTGETGAGKSLIIDALGLLFGERSSLSMIRTGETTASVEGVFENISKNTKQVLEKLQIELLENDTVIIKRTISAQGKNLIRVNGEIITLFQLEMLGSTLGDIHTQNDTHKLFNEQNYLTFINNDEIVKIEQEYQVKRIDYLDKLKKYQELVNLSKTDTTNLEFWIYQFNELEKASLSVLEEKALQEELDYLNNFDTIYKLLASINETLNKDRTLDGLYDVLSFTQKLSKYKNEFQKDVDLLNDCYYNLEDFALKIKTKLNTLDYDDERINTINERLSFLANLKHKYHRNISELISYKFELKEKIDHFEQIDDKIELLKQDVQKSFLNLVDISTLLTTKRKESAKVLEENMLTTLNDLNLKKVQIKFDFKPYDLDDFLNDKVFKKNGCDEVDCKISLNVGEALKPLSKVASGGEMSRIMLALKVHTLKTLQLSTVIFDEIDSGISGSVAKMVALKLKEISKNVQLLSITHLPIVASFSDAQYHIYKEFDENTTKTKVKCLTKEERINVISEMISPNDPSLKAKELASSMLENEF